MSGAPDFVAIFEATRSLFQQLGLFESVDTHEAKDAPGIGLRVEIFLSDPPIMPAPTASGLANTSYVVNLQARIRSDFRQMPYDGIDPAVAQAAFNVIAAFSGDFNISGSGTTAVDWVDLLGAYSQGLRTNTGYIKQDNRMYRVIDIFIPYVITDASAQVQ